MVCHTKSQENTLNVDLIWKNVKSYKLMLIVWQGNLTTLIILIQYLGIKLCEYPENNQISLFKTLFFIVQMEEWSCGFMP